MKRKIGLSDVVLVGVLSAVVFVSNYLQIPIPTIGPVSRIHFANTFCLLAAMLLGGLRGGLAAGIGSMFFDLLNPLYIADAPITFLNKFIMGFVCGKIAYSGGRAASHHGFNLAAAICGSLSYVVLYVGKSFLSNYLVNGVLGTALLEAAQKAGTSLINAAIAVVFVMILHPIFRQILLKTNLYRKVQAQGK